MSLQKEKTDRGIGLLVSLGVHAVVILLFFFILAWKQPYPPKPEYGIELNFGMEEAGSGDEQPQTVSNTPQVLQKEEQPEEQPEESQIQEDQIVEEEPATPVPAEPLPEEVQEQPEEDIQDSKQEDSPVEATPEIEEKKEKVKEPEPVEESKVVEEKSKEIAKLPEKTVEEPVRKPPAKKVNEKAMYPAKKGGSEGETKDEKGDAGKPDGTIEARAIYGKQGGGGGGPRLDLPGWKWDFTPKPEDKSSEEGKIVFELRVDDQGEVTGVKTLESTVSPDILKIYKREVERLTFSPTNTNSLPPPVSKGKITFIIRAK